jgi:hypothetical protein
VIGGCALSLRSFAHLRGGMALGRGFYVPQIARAQISFGNQALTSDHSPGKVEISNSFHFRPLLFKLTGPTQYLGKKSLLKFDFTHMQLSLSVWSYCLQWGV